MTLPRKDRGKEQSSTECTSGGNETACLCWAFRRRSAAQVCVERPRRELEENQRCSETCSRRADAFEIQSLRMFHTKENQPTKGALIYINTAAASEVARQPTFEVVSGVFSGSSLLCWSILYRFVARRFSSLSTKLASFYVSAIPLDYSTAAWGKAVYSSGQRRSSVVHALGRGTAIVVWTASERTIPQYLPSWS